MVEKPRIRNGRTRTRCHRGQAETGGKKRKIFRATERRERRTTNKPVPHSLAWSNFLTGLPNGRPTHPRYRSKVKRVHLSVRNRNAADREKWPKGEIKSKQKKKRVKRLVRGSTVERNKTFLPFVLFYSALCFQLWTKLGWGRIWVKIS